MKARERLGFTLLELSIVLIIIALVTGMAVHSGISVVETARLIATQKKMKAIEEALMQYRTSNDRLPCPGDLTIIPGSANYGLEAGSATGAGTGACTGAGMQPQANFTGAGSTNTSATGAEGALPAVTLGLSSDFMYDGWGNQFRYVVDINYTALAAFANTPIGCINGAVSVNDANGNARSTSSVYALISHGANGHGAYTRTGAVVNAGSVNANELTNCHCNSSGISTGYAPTYVQMQQTQDPANSLDNFDDLVSYKERWQMQTAWDKAGMCTYIYIGDTFNSRIRAVNLSNGIITTIAGIGGSGWDGGSWSGNGGPATSAALNNPTSIAVDSLGNIYISDSNNNSIRKIAVSTGIITNYAGVYYNGYTGDGGPASSASLQGQGGIAFDRSDNLYIADSYNNRIRKVTAATGIITTVAGSGATGSGSYSGDGGPATNATLNGPGDVAVDSSGNIYIADTGNQRIRKVTAATGIITTIAGNGTGGYNGDGIPATTAEIDSPYGVAVDSSGNVYIGDTNNGLVRKVTAATGIITTVAGWCGWCGYNGDGIPATTASINAPWFIRVDSSGNIYIPDFGGGSPGNRIRKVTAGTGLISTVAGNGTGGYSGDGGSATSAEINRPQGVGIGR